MSAMAAEQPHLAPQAAAAAAGQRVREAADLLVVPQQLRMIHKTEGISS
jgi:hypothetical protein